MATQETGSTAALWLRWVAANAVAELVGLGLTGATAVVAFPALMEAEGQAAWALMALMVAGGTLIEGLIVGTAQWLVLRGPLPRLTWRAWAIATGLGAMIAWMLGMLPSTLMSAGAEAAGAPAPEVSDALMYALAALMGLALGPVLATPQWAALRGHVRRAAWWIPANALAWALGMAVIFAGMGALPQGGVTASAVVIVLLSLAAAGAAVGAVHGLALVWLLRERA
jgi:hypothetical protein